jgi:hypothetical protein
MLFYGFEIPDKDLKGIKLKLKQHVSKGLGCPTEGCQGCVLYLKRTCLPCNIKILSEYEHLKFLGASARRDILFKEIIDLKSIVQEEFEV